MICLEETDIFSNYFFTRNLIRFFHISDTVPLATLEITLLSWQPQ